MARLQESKKTLITMTSSHSNESNVESSIEDEKKDRIIDERLVYLEDKIIDLEAELTSALKIINELQSLITEVSSLDTRVCYLEQQH